MKARSRLKSATDVSPHVYTDTPTVSDYSTSKTKPFTSHHGPQASPKISISWPSWIAKLLSLIPWSSYLHHIFTLILGLLGYLGLAYLVTHFDPAEMADLGLNHLYLPLQVLFFISNLFLWSFVWLHSRRGLLMAVWLQILLFLKLQLVAITWELALLLLAVFVIIELLSTWYERRSTPDHANVKQTAFHRRHRAHS